MIRLLALALVAVLATGCGGGASCETLDQFYADCCIECGEEDSYCVLESGGDADACDAAVGLIEAFGGSIDEAECLCD